MVELLAATAAATSAVAGPLTPAWLPGPAAAAIVATRSAIGSGVASTASAAALVTTLVPARPRLARALVARAGRRAGACGATLAASFLGAAPPSADLGAAMMRAGSAPMPSTPRLPCVRISKSRSSRPPTPKASRALRMASSTVLPVNSWYSLIDVSLAGCCVAWPA